MARHRQNDKADREQDQTDAVDKAVRDVVSRNEKVHIDPHDGNRPGKHDPK